MSGCRYWEVACRVVNSGQGKWGTQGFRKINLGARMESVAGLGGDRGWGRRAEGLRLT